MTLNQPYPYNRSEVNNAKHWRVVESLQHVPVDGQFYCAQDGLWVLNPVQLVAGTTNSYNIVGGGSFTFDPSTDLTIDAGTF
jgi:hypothetical protein